MVECSGEKIIISQNMNTYSGKKKLLPIGATIGSIIIATDQTSLSVFSGDKKAWPVYLTLGNIAKSVCRKPSSRAYILLGYIPVSKLKCFSDDHRSVEGYQLFHDCMHLILEPLERAGREGIEMECADGWIRRVYPLLAAYIADYPEQCLVCCCKENSCPKCLVRPKERDSPVSSVLQDPEKTRQILVDQLNGLHPKEFKDQNLRPINPFWMNLPHCDIFACMTPDLLHQLHKGVFSDHVAKWAVESVEVDEGIGKEAVDSRFCTMSHHPSLRHFKCGISLISQWTGAEYKAMEKVFLGTLIGIADDEVLCAVRAIEDFIYYAHFEVHCDESLATLNNAWATFHRHKYIFEDLGIRNHFNISKLHNIKHYIDTIRLRGTADGYNTEATKCLHIDLAKCGYRASNKHQFTVQMTTWLAR